ncbi:MAG: acetyl-CoA C-acyltransferase [Thermoplasmataceae archaeon]
MNEVYIVVARRTPIGKYGKSLKGIRSNQLGAISIKGVLTQSGIDPFEVDEVIMGNTIQAGNGQNLAGQCASLAGLPDTVTKYTVNVVCASGMLATESGAREIMLGEKDLVITGGVESMSNSPFMMDSDFRWGVKHLTNKHMELMDAMLKDGLLEGLHGEHMGIYAEDTARKYKISRDEADEFSLRSYQLASHYNKSGKNRDELIQMDQLAMDEGIRETTKESLSNLKPAFRPDGILTPGNSSQLSDGSSALILASEKALNDHNLKPIGRITGFSSASLAPKDFVEAPIPATKKLLEKQGKKISDYDIFEHNEAYSVASIVVRNQLGIEPDALNVRGGAIAIGHPLGNSGSRILVTLLHAMRERKLSNGLATICHGGGGAHTMTLEAIY